MLALLREQIEVRQKVLNQKVVIPFTCSKKQRPIQDIIDELSQYIQRTSSSYVADVVNHPSSLTGKAIWHRFVREEQEKWYSGTIINYDFVSKLFELVYDDDVEHYFFDLMEDVNNGDLIIK